MAGSLKRPLPSSIDESSPGYILSAARGSFNAYRVWGQGYGKGGLGLPVLLFARPANYESIEGCSLSHPLPREHPKSDAEKTLVMERGLRNRLIGTEAGH